MSWTPLAIGLFEDAASPLPVVRMVFALAAPHSSVSVRPARLPSPSEYTAFDIWCAGCSSETFLAIDRTENEAYRSILYQTIASSAAYAVLGLPPTAVDIECCKKYVEAIPVAVTSNLAHWRKYVTDDSTSLQEDDDDSTADVR